MKKLRIKYDIETFKEFRMLKKEDYFKHFMWSCFEKSYGASHDFFVNSEMISEFTPQQKAIAEKMILEQLPIINDSRPIIAAGVMRLRKAAPILKERLTKGFKEGYESLRVEVAHSLYLIENWNESLKIITSVIENTPVSELDFSRQTAVQALADFGKNPYVLSILFESIEDEDSLVGLWATDSLKKIYKNDKKVLSLLAQMEKVQIRVVRQKPEFIEKRRVLFQKLEKLASIRMPLIKKTA